MIISNNFFELDNDDKLSYNTYKVYMINMLLEGAVMNKRIKTSNTIICSVSAMCMIRMSCCACFSMYCAKTKPA